MPRSREEAQDAAETFMNNYDRGDDPANDQLVQDLDPRPDLERNS